MRKSEELTSPTSCINKSQPDEWLFVLCARDPHAPAAVRKWADDYEAAGGRSGKVAEARSCAERMEVWRAHEPPGKHPIASAEGLLIGQLVQELRNSSVVWWTAEHDVLLAELLRRCPNHAAAPAGGQTGVEVPDAHDGNPAKQG